MLFLLIIMLSLLILDSKPFHRQTWILATVSIHVFSKKKLFYYIDCGYYRIVIYWIFLFVFLDQKNPLWLQIVFYNLKNVIWKSISQIDETKLLPGLRRWLQETFDQSNNFTVEKLFVKIGKEINFLAIA